MFFKPSDIPRLYAEILYWQVPDHKVDQLTAQYSQMYLTSKRENKLTKLSKVYDQRDHDSFDPWNSADVEVEQLRRVMKHDYNSMEYNKDAYNNSAIASFTTHFMQYIDVFAIPKTGNNDSLRTIEQIDAAPMYQALEVMINRSIYCQITFEDKLFLKRIKKVLKACPYRCQQTRWGLNSLLYRPPIRPSVRNAHV